MENEKVIMTVEASSTDFYRESGRMPHPALDNANLKFEYVYDIASIFEYFGMLDATNLAKKIGMNPSLLRQYKNGIALASEKQKKRIENGLHQLGRELLEVRL